MADREGRRGKLTPADAGDFLAGQVFGAPWHFQWQWYNGGPPVYRDVYRPNGRMWLQTYAGGDRDWSTAHGGFGVSLSSNTVRDVSGRSLRRTQHSFSLGAGNLGGTASGSSTSWVRLEGQVIALTADFTD